MGETPGVQRLAVLAVLAALVALGAGLRLWGLDRESAYSDEVASLQHLDAPTLSEFLRRERISDSPMTPLYFTLEYGWARMTGGSLVAMRLLSVALGVACIPLLFVLARVFYGTLGGLTAAGLFSVSLTQTYYAQEVRPYALILALALISALSLWRAAHGGRAGWLVSVAANVALMWTHLFTVLLPLAQGCYLAVDAWRNRRPMRVVWWVLAHVPSLLLLALWVRSIDRAGLEVAAAWRHGIVHSYLQPLGDLLQFGGAGVPRFRDLPAIGGINVGSIVWRFYAGVLALNLFLTAWHWRTASAHAEKSDILDRSCFLWTWLLAPSAALFLFSALAYACHSSRYVLYGAIPFFVLAGGTAVLVRRRVFQALLLLALLAVNALALHAYPRPWRPDIAGAARFLLTQDISQDASVTVHIMADVPSFAYNGPAGIDRLRFHGVNTQDDAVQRVCNSEDEGAAAWLVFFQHEFADEAVSALEQALGSRGWSFEKTTLGYASPVHVYKVRRDCTQP